MLQTLREVTFYTEVSKAPNGELLIGGGNRDVPAGAWVKIRAVAEKLPGSLLSVRAALVSTEIEEEYKRGNYSSNRRPVYAWVFIGTDIADPKADRLCTLCKGEGTIFRKGFSGTDQTTGKAYSYPDKTSVCYACAGAKKFSFPDIGAILKAITATKGKNKGTLRASRPKNYGRDYYVWRWARFHGGKDRTLPMTAEFGMSGDPFTDELQQISEVVAKRAYGTDRAGSAAWIQAMGIEF